MKLTSENKTNQNKLKMKTKAQFINHCYYPVVMLSTFCFVFHTNFSQWIGVNINYHLISGCNIPAKNIFFSFTKLIFVMSNILLKSSYSFALKQRNNKIMQIVTFDRISWSMLFYMQTIPRLR